VLAQPPATEDVRAVVPLARAPVAETATARPSAAPSSEPAAQVRTPPPVVPRAPIRAASRGPRAPPPGNAEINLAR